jgi:hypothetical protein
VPSALRGTTYSRPPLSKVLYAMSFELCASGITAVFAATAAITAAAIAWRSHLLSRKIYDEIKSDEVLVAGPVHRVGLQEADHDDCLIRVTLFNKSARKAFVTAVKVSDQNWPHIECTWGDSIDKVGTIQNPTGLLGVIDSKNIYIRRNDAQKFGQVNVEITHSFSNEKIVLVFDPYQGWW